MSREALTAQKQALLKETITKETNGRLKFFLKDKYGDPSKASIRTQILRKGIEERMRANEEVMHKVPADYKPLDHRITTRAKHLEDEAILKMADAYGTSKEGTVHMAPPTKSQVSLLMDGFTKEGKGRYAYLKRRIRIIPEDKFIFPDLSSWDYGWRQGNYVLKSDLKKPTFARSGVVSKTFYRNNGVPFNYDQLF